MSDQSRRLTSKSLFGAGAPAHAGSDGLSLTWIVRGGNFAVCYSHLRKGAMLERGENPEEYMVILPHDGAAVRFTAGEGSMEGRADSLTIVPPGFSRIEALSDGTMVRIFSKAAADIIDMASNRAVYADEAPELAPPDLWPVPADGYRLRHYAMADYGGPVEQTTPRLFRSTNMMVNLFAPVLKRRDTTALSPHWHDDFEQGSLALAGNWVHHIRYNWGPDLGKWHPDEHCEIGSPSIMIIPARAIHTSMDVGEDGPEARLVDIFCPPRLDFASKPGFVLNEKEYPLPQDPSQAGVKTGGTLLSWQASG